MANPETLSAFASGTSPQTAIKVEDFTTANGEVDIEDITVDIDKMLDVNSTICIEKEIAADTIGAVFASTREHFLPYVEETTLELIGQLPHYYDGIRKSATDSLLEIIRTFYELSNPPEWQPGYSNIQPLEPKVKEIINHIIPSLLEMYESEDNK